MKASELSSCILLSLVLAVVVFLSGCAGQKGPTFILDKKIIINGSRAVTIRNSSENKVDAEFIQEMKDLLDLDSKVSLVP